MKEYTKIQTVFKRDERNKIVEGSYTLPEFEYLKDNIWVFTEKVDGTNIRVMWQAANRSLKFGGKTDQAQIPVTLLYKLQELFTEASLAGVFPETEVCIYGEGYGAKIQRAGASYIADGVDFVLFDVKIGEWWLQREDIIEIAGILGVRVVPIIV